MHSCLCKVADLPLLSILKFLFLVAWACVLTAVSIRTVHAITNATESLGNVVMKSAVMNMVYSLWDWQHVITNLLAGRWLEAITPRFLSSPSFPFSPLPSSLPLPPFPLPPAAPSLPTLNAFNAFDYSSVAGLFSFSLARCLAWAGVNRRTQLLASTSAWIVGIASRF